MEYTGREYAITPGILPCTVKKIDRQTSRIQRQNCSKITITGNIEPRYNDKENSKENNKETHKEGNATQTKGMPHSIGF